MRPVGIERHFCNINTCYLFMANHLHIIFTVKDPDHVQKFVRLIKGRLSHAINKLLGRTKGVVWDEGFDDPKILDIDMLVTRLVYIYLNPAQANLVDSIEQYPGVNSWKYFKEGTSRVEREVPVIAKRDLFPVPKRQLSQTERRAIEQELREASEQTELLVIEPLACFEAFSSEEAKEVYHKRVLKQVEDKQRELHEGRQKAGRSVVGRALLMMQKINKAHSPKKWGKRMICLGTHKEDRQEYIRAYRAFCDKCAEVYQRWKEGDHSVAFPPGGYPPPLPHRVCSLLAFSTVVQ